MACEEVGSRRNGELAVVRRDMAGDEVVGGRKGGGEGRWRREMGGREWAWCKDEGCYQVRVELVFLSFV